MKYLLPRLPILLTLILAIQANTIFADDTAEVEKKAKSFLKWDNDGDQQLNPAEYESMVKAQFDKNGQSGYEQEAKKRFKRKDANKDGLVSFDEQYGMKLPE